MSVTDCTVHAHDEPPFRLQARARVGGDDPAVTPVEVGVRFGPARDGAPAMAVVRLDVQAGSPAALRLADLLQRGVVSLREGASTVELDIHAALNAGR